MLTRSPTPQRAKQERIFQREEQVGQKKLCSYRLQSLCRVLLKCLLLAHAHHSFTFKNDSSFFSNPKERTSLLGSLTGISPKLALVSPLSCTYS